MHLKFNFKWFCLLIFFLCFVNTSYAASPDDLAEFTTSAKNIEKLIDSNVELANKQLMRYKHRLNELSIEQQITYHSLLADIYTLKAQYNLAKKTASMGLSLTKELSSPSLLIAELLYSRGFANESMGDFTLAKQDYESGLDIAKSFHDKVLIATGLVNIGAIYYLSDNYEDSLKVLNDAYNISKQTKDDELKGSVNSELGILYSYLDRSKQAMEYYQQAYQHYKSAGKTILSLNALLNIATNHLDNEEYDEAITAYQTIIKESHGVGQNEIMYGTYSGLAWANLKREPSNPEASYQYLLMAKQYVNSIERHDIELQFAIDESFVLYELERFDEALVSIGKIEKILNASLTLGRMQLNTQEIIVNLKAEIYFKLGHFKQALQLQKTRLKLAKNLLQKEHIKSVSELRLRLEAKQADIHKRVLEKNRSLQSLALTAAEEKQQQQRIYLTGIAILALLLAWLLVKLVQGQRNLYKALSVDMLTGIANRRSLMKRGQQLFQKTQTSKSDLSVLMIDVDQFKKVNDRFGHKVGDIVLQNVADIGMQLMRKSDVLGRYGGEEFIVFLPNTSLQQALNIAERFRLAVVDHSWEDTELTVEQFSLSISIGVCSVAHLTEEEKSDLNTVIDAADQKLYQAKSSGRNKVCS